jgi:hypothetical protein
MKFNQNDEGFGVFFIEFKATTAIDFKNVYSYILKVTISCGKARRQSRATVPLKKNWRKQAWTLRGFGWATACSLIVHPTA